MASEGKESRMSLAVWLQINGTALETVVFSTARLYFKWHKDGTSKLSIISIKTLLRILFILVHVFCPVFEDLLEKSIRNSCAFWEHLV